MSGQLVRCLYEGKHLFVILQHQMGIAVPKGYWEHGEKPVPRNMLHLLVGVLDAGIVVFDGGGQIAGENFRGVMVESCHGAAVRIRGGKFQNVPADQGQGVGEHRYLVTMLGDVFRKGIAHQPPAGDVAHPPHQGVKFIGHKGSPSILFYPMPAISLSI